MSNKTGSSHFYQRAADSNDADTDELLGVGILCDWSRDGRFLLLNHAGQKTGRDLLMLQMDGAGKPSPVVRNNFNNLWGQFSPDGQWMAYQSNESGRFEIYVRALSNPRRARLDIGRDTCQMEPGRQGALLRRARWQADGGFGRREGCQARAGHAPGALSASHGRRRRQLPRFSPAYDVAPDGRFLINVASTDAAPPITLSLNWKPTP